VFVSVNKVCLLWTTDCQIFLFNLVCHMVSFDGKLSPLTFLVSIGRNVVIPVIWLFLLFKDLSMCSWSMLLSKLLFVLLMRFNTLIISWSCLFLSSVCVGFLSESSIVVNWWSYIVLVSVYRGKLLFLTNFEWWLLWVEYHRTKIVFFLCSKYLAPWPFCL
jgi:hypothetical protein